jgi:hypothetical protein
LPTNIDSTTTKTLFIYGKGARMIKLQSIGLQFDAGRWWSCALDGDEGIELRFLPWRRDVDCVWGAEDMGGASAVHGKNDWTMVVLRIVGNGIPACWIAARRG